MGMIARGFVKKMLNVHRWFPVICYFWNQKSYLMERDSLAENLGLTSFPNTGGRCVSTFTWTIHWTVSPVCHEIIISQACRLRRDVFKYIVISDLSNELEAAI
jgi:hypothetical protein